MAAQIRAQVDNDEVLVSFHPWSMNGIRFYCVGPNRFVDVYPCHEFRDFHSRRFGSRLACVVMHGSVSRTWIEERIDPAVAAASFREVSRAEIEPIFELVRYERDPSQKSPKPPRRPRRPRP